MPAASRRALLALFLIAFAASGLAAAEHTVRKGETLTEIANRYGVSVKDLKAANRISNPNKIKVGQGLFIPDAASRTPPPALVDYVVRKGDSLSLIAKRGGITLSELARINNVRDADMIRVGQVLKIPAGGAAASPAYSSLDPDALSRLRAISPKRGQWKRIVIHHSGSRSGSAKAFDRFHREERHMENGLAYHFVIGNGNGMADGEIAVGDRWRRQIQGGHLSSHILNEISIGICLVGDFEKTAPSRRQMDQLEALVLYLVQAASIEPDSVTTHKLIHPKHTLCPGRKFPAASFMKAIGASR